MLRLFWGAFALACGVTQAFPAPPTPADESGSAPMRFEWRREGPAEACGANCRIWISAVGYITADTPREFEAFAKDPNTRGAVLVLDSDGGSVLGTLALGRSIRSLDMITTSARRAAAADRRSATAARRCLPTAIANPCARSCCWRAPVATCRRRRTCSFTRFGSARSASSALESNYSAEELNVVQRDIGRLAQYTIEMGGGGDLLETALRIPPWEPLYRLSADELRAHEAQHRRCAVRPRPAARASIGQVGDVTGDGGASRRRRATD